MSITHHSIGLLQSGKGFWTPLSRRKGWHQGFDCFIIYTHWIQCLVLKILAYAAMLSFHIYSHTYPYNKDTIIVIVHVWSKAK